MWVYGKVSFASSSLEAQKIRQKMVQDEPEEGVFFAVRVYIFLPHSETHL